MNADDMTVEVYDGLRCAICEERFKPGDDQKTGGQMGEQIHAACWSDPRHDDKPGWQR